MNCPDSGIGHWQCSRGVCEYEAVDTAPARVSPQDGFARAVTLRSPRSLESDYIFSGKLEKMEEVDYEGGVKVEVAMSAQITSVATGATVWSKAVSEVGTVSRRTVPAVVSQMNQTTELAIDKLLSTLPSPLPSSKH